MSNFRVGIGSADEKTAELFAGYRVEVVKKLYYQLGIPIKSNEGKFINGKRATRN